VATKRVSLLLLGSLGGACSPATPPTPAAPDAGSTQDAGLTQDSGPAPDAASRDGGHDAEAEAGPPPRHIVGIHLVGAPTLVFDHLADKQQALNLPDAQVTAWKEKDGTCNLTIPHYENYRMRGTSLLSLHIDAAEIFSSSTQASDIVEAHYDYHHWFMAPYTLDGLTVYALAHSEWYACLLEGDCATGQNQLDSWVTTITSFVSTNGGATWAVNGVDAAHDVAALGYTWTGSQALANGVYRTALDHTGLMTPSRLIEEGGRYYSIGFLVHRDFSQIDAMGVAPIDKYGYVLIRTGDLANPSGWEGWTGGASFAPLTSGQYVPFLPKVKGAPYNGSQVQIVRDVQAQVYVLIFAPWGSNGAVYYMTSPSLATPVWSDAVEIGGSAGFATDPRSAAAPCNTGFQAANYVSILDDKSAGYDFEFTLGNPWLFYVVNPALCNGDNLARDLYRAQLVIDYP
jgi:hypothetical protein